MMRRLIYLVSLFFTPLSAAQAAMLTSSSLLSAISSDQSGFAVTTASTGLSLDGLMDVILIVESRSWMVNRYVRGSARNSAYLSGNPARTTYVAYSEYDYEGILGPASGWVRVTVVGGDLLCLEFWDQPGVCRPPWMALSQQRLVDALRDME